MFLALIFWSGSGRGGGKGGNSGDWWGASGREVFVALEAGEARFFLRTRKKAGPCRVSGVGGRFEGELCELGVRGWKEFRGWVPRGRFQIRSGGGLTKERKKRARGEEVLSPAKGWSYQEGARVPRFHGEGGGSGAQWKGDLFHWGRGRWELCLELVAKEEVRKGVEGLGGGKGAGGLMRVPSLRIPLPEGLEVSSLWPPGELAWKKEGKVLVLDLGPAGLREGDRSWVSLSLGMLGAAPSRRILPAGWAEEPASRARGAGTKGIWGLGSAGGYGGRSAGGSAGLDLMALPLLVDRLLAATPKDPRDRGDFLRVFPGGHRLWTHGEFDLPLALGRAARLLGRADVLELAQLSARHVFGRDLGDGAAGRALLPAQHSGRHGGDRIQPGHVFLQGALGLALCSGDRAFLAFLHRVGAELRGRVLSREWRPKALRDLAWPLLAFESAHRVWEAEGSFGRASRLILEALDRAWDRPRGGFAFPEDRNEEEHKAFRPLWIEGGLLVPGLCMAGARGRPLARSLLRRLKRDFHRLGLRRDPFARALASGRGPWRRAGGRLAGKRDPLAEAWVLEGLWRLEGRGGRALARRARQCLAHILRGFRAPPEVQAGLGRAWDPATRLAIALQASWVRASLEAGLSGSPGLHPRSPSPSDK